MTVHANVVRVVSGGQTGVDRAALDVAIANGVVYGGWCPRDGWAEDQPTPPGLLLAYPDLQQTPSRDVAERTAWNVRDSDATLIAEFASAGTASTGTALTRELARRYDRPCLTVDLERPTAVADVRGFLDALAPRSVLNIAGPRESEAPGIYVRAREFLDVALGTGATRSPAAS